MKLKLPTTLLHEQADACLAQWAAQSPTEAQPSLELDASELVEFDSSALAVLLGLRRLVKSRGGTLRIHAMPERLRELAGLYGVLDLLAEV